MTTHSDFEYESDEYILVQPITKSEDQWHHLEEEVEITHEENPIVSYWDHCEETQLTDQMEPLSIILYKLAVICTILAISISRLLNNIEWAKLSGKFVY
jgi:hypothetical protein